MSCLGNIQAPREGGRRAPAPARRDPGGKARQPVGEAWPGDGATDCGPPRQLLRACERPVRVAHTQYAQWGHPEEGHQPASQRKGTQTHATTQTP